MKIRSNLPLLACSAFALSVVFSCATVSYEQDFLNKRLDDKAKAKALVDVGTVSFNNLVKDRGAVEPVDLIEEYFQVALKFDPNNETALRMISAIDDYRAAKIRDSLAEAKKLMAKDNRKDDENLNLLIAINKAYTLDPKSADVIKLKADTEKLRKEMITAKINAAKAAVEKANAAKTDSARDDLLVNAWTTINQALKIDPAASDAISVRDSLAKQIGSMVDTRLTGLDKLVKDGKFSAAKNQIDSADTLNLKLGGASTAAIASARYDLYSKWANYLYANKDYDAAEARAGQAYDIKRTAEMRNILTTIAEKRTKDMAGANYVANLAAIDKMIGSGDLVGALKLANNMSTANTDADKQTEIDARKKKINAAIPDLYNRGVTAYRAEKFDVAVQTLGTVVALNPDYEQAKDFLDKAAAKKKLLDQY